MAERWDNYALQVQQAKRRFLEYDQGALIRKCRLSRDEDYLYLTLFGMPYRLSRKNGDLERKEGGVWADANSHAEVMTVLDLLCDMGELSVKELCYHTGASKATVDRLEKLELVKRVRSDEDRRVIYVALTDKYRAALQSEQPNVNDCFSGVLEKLTEEERAGIAAVLDKLCRVLNEDEN